MIELYKSLENKEEFKLVTSILSTIIERNLINYNDAIRLHRTINQIIFNPELDIGKLIYHMIYRIQNRM